MVASQNVLTGSGNPGLNSKNNGVPSGNMTFIAGADYSVSDTAITIKRCQSVRQWRQGRLQANTGLQQIDTSSFGGGPGGSVNMVAYAGGVAGSGVIRIPTNDYSSCQWKRRS